MQTTPSPAPARCPLCGAPNACAMALAPEAGVDPATCWCMTADFATDVLARVPLETRGLACVCARCAAGTPK